MLSGHYYKILNFNQVTKQMLFFTERKKKLMRLQGKVSDDKYTEAKKKKKTYWEDLDCIEYIILSQKGSRV